MHTLDNSYLQEIEEIFLMLKLLKIVQILSFENIIFKNLFLFFRLFLRVFNLVIKEIITLEQISVKLKTKF